MKTLMLKSGIAYYWRSIERGLFIGFAVASLIEVLTIVIVAAVQPDSMTLSRTYWHTVLLHEALCMAVGAVTGLITSMRDRTP